MTTQENMVIYDFQLQANHAEWRVMDDGVMGGLSKGKITKSDQGNGLFKGFVTTENYGGFSSIRYGFYKRDVSRFKSVKIRLKGDGKPYQFRIKSREADQFSYIQEFETSGDWEIITIPFDDFYPSFRGNKLSQPNYDGKFIEEVAFLIGNKRKESFALEIERIWVE